MFARIAGGLRGLDGMLEVRRRQHVAQQHQHVVRVPRTVAGSRPFQPRDSALGAGVVGAVFRAGGDNDVAAGLIQRHLLVVEAVGHLLSEGFIGAQGPVTQLRRHHQRRAIPGSGRVRHASFQHQQRPESPICHQRQITVLRIAEDPAAALGLPPAPAQIGAALEVEGVVERAPFRPRLRRKGLGPPRLFARHGIDPAPAGRAHQQVPIHLQRIAGRLSMQHRAVRLNQLHVRQPGSTGRVEALIRHIDPIEQRNLAVETRVGIDRVLRALAVGG